MNYNGGGPGYPPLGFDGMMPQPNFNISPSGGFGAPPYPTQGGSIGGGFPIAQPTGAPAFSPYPSSSYAPPPSQPSYNNYSSYPTQPSYPNNNYPPPQPSSSYYPSPTSSYSSYPTSIHDSYSNQASNNIYPSLNNPNAGYGNAGSHYAPQSYHQPVSNPVLRPYQPFNPADDAARLYKAMKGLGTDEAALIDILCKRTSDQRQQIVAYYKTSYGKDLLRNVESETSGDFRQVLRALLLRPAEFQASEVRDAVQGLGTNETTLIDIICSQSNAEMIELKNTYRRMYNRNIEDDVKDDLSGYFKRFLISLMSGNRLNSPPDPHKAVQQAQELYRAGEGRWGTNEMVFNRIFALESHAQLRLIFDEYEKQTRHPIENAIRSEMSTNVQRAFLAVVQVARNPAGFYAERLHDSMKGLGTKDRVLVRTMVLRSEIDMQDIKSQFQMKYGKSLEQFIRSDTSGDYRRALLCLAGDSNWKR